MEDPEGGEVEDAVHTFHCLLKNIPVEDVPAAGEYGNSRVAHGVPEIAHASAKEVVVNDDLGCVGFDEFINEVAADKAGAADNKDALSFLIQFTNSINEP